MCLHTVYIHHPVEDWINKKKKKIIQTETRVKFNLKKKKCIPIFQ